MNQVSTGRTGDSVLTEFGIAPVAGMFFSYFSLLANMSGKLIINLLTCCLILYLMNELSGQLAEFAVDISASVGLGSAVMSPNAIYKAGMKGLAAAGKPDLPQDSGGGGGGGRGGGGPAPMVRAGGGGGSPSPMVSAGGGEGGSVAPSPMVGAGGGEGSSGESSSIPLPQVLGEENSALSSACLLYTSPSPRD